MLLHTPKSSIYDDIIHKSASLHYIVMLLVMMLHCTLKTYLHHAYQSSMKKKIFCEICS